MKIKILLYWVVVAIPLAWGLAKAVEKSVPLFSSKVPVTVPVKAP